MAGFDRCAFENKSRFDEMKANASFVNKTKEKKEEHCDCHDHYCGCHDHDCGCGHHHESKKDKIILLVRVIISVLFLLLSLINNQIVNIIFIILAYIVIAYDVLFNAFKNIIKGKVFDENFLMSIASLTALLCYLFIDNIPIDGYDGVLVIILYQVGEFIQHFAVDKSKESITKMLDLDVNEVIKINQDKEEVINVNDIKIDDVLLIKPGDTIPVDGIIVNGSSSINTSSLTGESKPLDVYENDKVLSGCINNDGVILIKATSTIDNSTTAKVKKIIEEASKNKAKYEKFITRFAKVYTPIVILISLLVMFVVPLILGFNKYFIDYLYKGLAILVISCPCALVISIPLSYFMGIGKCAKNAILVKGSSYLEILSNVNNIAFDKTGTLTKGNFVVTHKYSVDERLMDNLLYSCEKNFTHAIALSICKYLEGKAEELTLETLTNIPGYGIKATFRGKEVLIGNKKLLNKNNVEIKEEINEIDNVIYVSYNKEFIGYLVISDEIKDDAKNAISYLNNKYNIHIISGDKKDVVKKVADTLEISNYHYEMLPDEKLKIVENINKNTNLVYVGDGINDAACLISSSCGIAMRSLGSDMAIKASDIVIMDDKISSINKAINISKKTMKTVKQNIVFSIAVKVLLMVLSIIFTLPMWVAIIGDVGVCLLAILSSLRIIYGKVSIKNV